MAKFKAFKLSNKAKKIKKSSGTWLTPNAAEREYRKELNKLLKQIKVFMDADLIPMLPYIFTQAMNFYPDRQDDWLGDLDKILINIRDKMRQPIRNTINEMLKIGIQISNFNSKQFEKILKRGLGVDIFRGEPWLKTQLENFSSQNIGLITDLNEETIDSIKQVVLLGVQEGTRFSETAKGIAGRYPIAYRRAKLIARDQTAKLNSSLTRLRQEEVGIKNYIWQTSGDERVRPTHRANDGKKFSWDRPPAKTGHPGTDINCRCTAIPVIPGIEDFI